MSDYSLEEMREMRTNQAALMSKLSELCGQVRELVVELRHTQQNYKIVDDRVLKIEQEVRQLQLDGALNKPILDIAKAMNNKMWMTIIGAIIAIGAGGVDWSKFIGS
jgi:predicted nuclease with TOPRIM domain